MMLPLCAARSILAASSSLSLPWLAPASHAYIAAALHEFRRVPRLLNDVSTRADVEMRGELLFSARRRWLLYFPEEEVFFVLGVDGFLFPFFLKVEFCLGEDDGWKFRRAPPDALPTSSFSFSLGAFVCVFDVLMLRVMLFREMRAKKIFLLEECGGR